MTADLRDVRIAFFLDKDPSGEPGPWINPAVEEVLSHLGGMGAEVECIVPEHRSWDLSNLMPAHDLYILRSKTPLSISIAGALTQSGASVLNTYRSTNLARDKVASTAILAAAGVPVPPSYTTGRAALFLPLLERETLWVKPYRGSRGMGIRRLSRPEPPDVPEECLDPYGLPLPFFVQEEFPSGPEVIKTYVVGDRVWAAERSPDKTRRPFPLPDGVRRAALMCGAALGLELYGVDFLLSGDRFAAVDINPFPQYKGVPEAPKALADHICRRALDAAGGIREGP